MKVMVGHTKGGTGKTTLALNLGVTQTLRGRDVWMVDADVQGTLLAALAQRGDRAPPIAAAHYTDGDALLSQMKQSYRYDDVVIDAGGRDSPQLRAGLIAVDVLLVPFQPRNFDLWALEDLGHLVKEAEEIRRRRGDAPLRILGVLNQADTAGQDNDQAMALATQTIPGLQALQVQIRRRKSYNNAAADGLAVTEFRPRDTKAIEEVEALVDAVFNNEKAIK